MAVPPRQGGEHDVRFVEDLQLHLLAQLGHPASVLLSGLVESADLLAQLGLTIVQLSQLTAELKKEEKMKSKQSSLHVNG